MSNDDPKAASPNPAPEGGPPSHIQVVDGSGRRVNVPREEYRTKVLPGLLKAHNDNPDQLAAVILQAARDGFADDVQGAANRLTVIDKQNVERALTVLAFVQREADELDLSEATLRELLQRKPGSPAAHVGLGMLEEKRGDVEKAVAHLWDALQQDCNHPDAVHGYLQLRHRQVGDDGYRAEVEKLMALDGAWRAHLWLARLHLNQGDEAAAVGLYRDVLAREQAQGDGMLMAAGDLVQAQKHALVEELVAPRFEPGRHHPHIGLALLQNYRMQQDHVKGEELLHRMHVHYGHMIPGDLYPFTAEFDRMRLQKLPAPPPVGENPQVQVMRLDRPAWYAGYEDPQWLLPQKAQGHKHVMLFAPSIDGKPQLDPAREDELGRATRGLPLWFAEQLWLASPHRGTAALPMAPNGGWAVLGRPWPEEHLASQIPEGERADTILVTGSIAVDGDRRRVTLWAYDCGKDERVGEVSAEGPVQEHGAMLLKLMAELWPIFGGPEGFKPQFGDGQYWHRYADGLAQHAALVVTQTGGMPKDRLYGERYITQWLQGTALAETRWQPAFWVLGSALCTLAQLGSNVPAEHGRLFAEVFRQSPPDSAIVRLCARILPACGLLPLWQGRRDEVLAAAENAPAVRAWIERVEQKQA